MLRLGIAGAAGRMGRALLELLESDTRFKLAAALVKEDDPVLGEYCPYPQIVHQSFRTTDSGKRADHAPPQTINEKNDRLVFTHTLTSPINVLIEFTASGGMRQWLDICRERKIALVIGSTGHSSSDLDTVRDAARMIPIVMAGNFSLGIHAVLSTLRTLVARLGPDYDVEVVEAHHRNKVDAPSGTAKMLIDEIVAARAQGATTIEVPRRGTSHAAASPIVYGRSGRTGPRPPGQVGVHALRMGDIVGEHQIHLSGPGETITIHHTVNSRAVFAAGALHAAAWVVTQPPGLYSMTNLLSSSASTQPTS